MNGWEGIEYTSVYRGAPERGPVTHLAERRPTTSGGSCAPYAARLSGLPPRSVADWGGHVSGCATVYHQPLSDGGTGSEIFLPTAFANDDGIEVPILALHDYDRHVGWCRLEHRADGLYFTGQLRRGMARSIGTWRGVSLGFCGGVSVSPGRVRKHVVAQALEVSVCERGAHHPHSFIKLLDDELALAA